MEAAALAGAKRPREEAIEEHKGVTPADTEASASAMPLSGGESLWTEYTPTNAAVNEVGLLKPVRGQRFEMHTGGEPVAKKAKGPDELMSGECLSLYFLHRRLN